MTTLISGRRGARNLLLSAAVLGGAAFAAAPASAGVTLDWTTANVANSRAPTDTERTWLGYVTNPAPNSAKGTASPIAPATGPTVTPESPRGLDQLATWELPAVSGSIQPALLRGTMQFDGGVSFVSPTPVPTAGHGFTLTLEDPRVELAGDGTGLLYATGLRPTTPPGSPSVPYDASQPVFRFTNATWSLNADGSSSMTLVPEVAESLYVFPTPYIAGRGPERTPNTFGSFSITVAPDGGPAGANGRDGTNGTNGANGRDGAAGKNGTTTVVRVQTSSLSKAPFKGKAAHKVRVTARRGGKTLAKGTVKGRSITFTLEKGIKQKRLKGVYVLHLVKGRGSATVRLP
jgi:hypothetical protein